MPITTTPYGFIPTQITGCVLWLDASDATTITQSGGNISQWADKSTSALTATAANNPTFIANIQNGLPGISLDGSTQYFNLGNNLNMGTNQIYIFVVSKFNSTADGAIIGKSLYGSAGARYSLLRSGAMIPLIEASGGAVNNAGLNSDTSTSSRLLNMVWDRSNIYLYQNGSSVFSAGLSDSSNLTTGNSLLIGAYQNSSGGTPPAAGLYMNGYIHEILMYSTSTASPLGNTSRQQIESYLAQKWGLTLGAGHPGLTSTVYRSTYLKNSAVKKNNATMKSFYTAFTPRQIAGCSLWLDGADPAGNGVIPAQDSQIGTWVDKSGNSRSMTTQGNGAYITYKKVNGINSVWFNNPSANNAYMRNMSFQVIPNGSVFMLFVPLAYSATWNFLWSWNPTASNYLVPGMRIQQDNKSLQLYLTFYGANNYGTTNNGVTYLSYFDWTNTTGTPLNWSLNGTIPPTAGTIGSMINNTSVSEFDLGNDTGATMPYGGYGNMYLSEMIIYNSVLSSTQRQQVESYLAQKWGLASSLPAGHLHLTQPAGAVTSQSLINSKITMISNKITSFKSFRWTITAGNTDGLIQFSEFQVGYNSNQIVFVSPTTATTGSTISWNTGAGEGPVQAVDNNLNTKGLGIGTSGLVLIVSVATPITANMYRWATANDVTPGRNPTQWTVDGSADGVTYVRLHTQNTAYSTPNTTFTFTSWINFTY